MHAQGEIDTHDRTIKRKSAANLQEWPQQEVNSMYILFLEIKWMRKVINEGVEALTRKAQASLA